MRMRSARVQNDELIARHYAMYSHGISHGADTLTLGAPAVFFGFFADVIKKNSLTTFEVCYVAR